MDAQKPDWFALTESDGAPRPAPKARNRKPLTALLLAGAVLAGGGFFANAEDDDDSYQAQPISITSKVDSPESAEALDPATAEVARTTVTKSVGALTPPAIAPVTNVGSRGHDDEDDDDDDDRYEEEH
ncbi:hypothetical protein MCEMRE203_01195 [Candidatus Nanopelagicaceae bacterium]